MKIVFPSREFDDAVAALCHGIASDAQVQPLNELLRTTPAALDEYILRIELHARLASMPDLFVSPFSDAQKVAPGSEPASVTVSKSKRLRFWAVAAAACLTFLMAMAWAWRLSRGSSSTLTTTSKAVAMLNQTIDAHWSEAQTSPQLGAPLDPGWLKLKGGLVQIVLYSGARLVLEGPAELELISPNRALCRLGKITAEVPPEARGFQLETPQGLITDLGTAFGVEVKERSTELHVFKGLVSLQPKGNSTGQMLREGAGAMMQAAAAPVLIAANPEAYASLLNLREKSREIETLRLERWRSASEVLNEDPSLRVRFDFEQLDSSPWQLQNLAQHAASSGNAAIIGCQFAKGRWPGKRALEFQSVSDRVRTNVPGEFSSLTLSAWVRVQGLDRKLNSLFMSDGFNPGTLHWLIRNDGALGLTIVGAHSGDYQLAISPSVVTLEKFGIWLHLAVVVDSRAGRVVHYVNGQPVATLELQVRPPFRVGTAELGNWEGNGFPKNDPFMIRNFSGTMDDFCLFDRALDGREIQKLYASGAPESEALALK